MSSLHLRLFGTPELRQLDRVIRMRTRKHLALFLYLALEGTKRPVSREFLIELLWPNLSPASGRHSLSEGLSVIRRTLGGHAVTRAKEEVKLTCSVSTDLDLLASGAAVQAQLDQPLEGIDTCAGPAFAHWVEATRERIRGLARERLATGLAAARSDGDVAKVHERAALLYQVDPLSDAAAHALAERQLLANDRVGAIQLLRRHARRTETDLGCPASAGILLRLRQLERGRGEAHPDDAGGDCSTAAPAGLIVREAEVARLEALWSAMTSRGLLTCVVTGPAGIGKSTLVRCFAASVASRGWPVFSVACQEIGRTIPFATVSDFIYALAADPAISGTDPVWLSEASRVTPGITSLYPGVPDPPPVAAESVRIRVAESISRVLEVVAEGGPTLLVFDDVQNMDPASREVLHVLLRRLEATPTFLLGAQRTTDSRSFHLAENPSFSGLAWQHAIPLNPLTAVQAEAFLASRVAAGVIDEVIRAKVIELAEGNPYLLEMLLMDWQRDGPRSLVVAQVEGDGTDLGWRPPDTMRRAFERQYRGLSSTAQRFLAVLAVAGKRISPVEVGELATLTDRETDLAALEVIDRGIVRVDGPFFSFKNEIHRAFVYSTLLSEDSRKYHHARLVRVLESRSDERDFQRALEASHHSLRAGMPEAAVAQVIKGARMAIAMGGPREAERALRGVSKFPNLQRRPPIQILLSKSLIAQGRYDQALKLVVELENLHLDHLQRTEVTVLRAESLHRGSLADSSTIAEAAREAARAAEGPGKQGLLARALQIRAEVAADEADLGALAEIAERTRSIAQSADLDEVRGLCRMTQGFCQMVRGEYRRAARNLRKAEGTMRLLSRDLDLRMVLNGLGICRTNTGQFLKAESHFLEAAKLARRLGDAYFESLAWDNLGVLYDDLGWFNRAAQAYRRALKLCLRSPTPRRVAHILSNAGSLETSLGHFREAQALLAGADEQARRHDGPAALVEVLVTRADLHLACLEDELAWQLVEEILTLTAGTPPLDGATGQFQRLKLHFLWATGGGEAADSTISRTLVDGLGNRLARQLEVQAFLELKANKGPETNPSAVGDIVERRLFGVIARLVALQIPRTNVFSQLTGESGADVVARLFPDRRRSTRPAFVVGEALLADCCGGR